MTERDGGCTIAVTGELDRSTVEVLDQAILEAEATTDREILLDLSPLDFMDSSGLRVIMKAHLRSQGDSRSLRLVPCKRRVQRVFELTSTESLLPFGPKR